MYSLATVIRDTDIGPTVYLMILDNNGFPILDVSETNWKELVNKSWQALSQANSKLYQLASKGRFKVDPFTIIVDRSYL